MNPAKVIRANVTQLTDLPNVGKATAEDLRLLGIEQPSQLQGQDPYQLYLKLCELTGVRQDPCVLDVLMSVVSFADGEAPLAWWHFTDERKKLYSV
ncbi:mitomycin resistance protein [Shewanella mangrovi]|uniref:Mitomycin resistance protein n=1 Tax=Shewanella mangrovi TaxID=1515746 RepID=A0A094JL51_9GAMM|nr:helix-hairpin-helix domain-containing protein [Shewanella mangrovi]KFZ38784.1 mitomycin resistance protein [Shewanella mangrovi]